MRPTFLAVLTALSPEDAAQLARASLRKDGYETWTRPIPGEYRGGPREILTVDVARQGDFVLFRPNPNLRAAHWALRLSQGKTPRAVVLYMGPEVDRVPGVGPVFRDGPGDEALLKIYADGEPWLKVGTAEDTEVAYPVPSIVAERAPTVFSKLEPFLGTLTSPLKNALNHALEHGTPSPAPLLQALGLSESFPTVEATLKLIHRDSPLFRNASPSPMDGGIE